ncbi:MAG TPA: hypothetical protein VKZ77_00745 [Bacillaceae bacterium]|nr:hypothetical protein [Paenibacillus bovis]HLU20991.1 hypothetical protein [Bacillaceae bacterium]
MGRKSNGEKLQELNTKISQLEARKERMLNRFKEQERKERTRRLIQVGAIFEKYFNIVGIEEAEKIAIGLNKTVKKHKDELMKINVKKSKQQNAIIFESQEESLIIPSERKSDYDATPNEE